MELLVNQMRSFFATIAIGMVVGFTYDYYRVTRGVLRLKSAGVFVGDIIFWVVTTIAVFLMLLWGNWGEMRLYVLLGLGLGALLYFHFISKSVRKLVSIKFYILNKVWEVFVKAVQFTWKVITYPFRLCVLIIIYPFNLAGDLFKKAVARLKSLFYRLLGRRLEMGITGIKKKLARLAFWKKNRE